MNKTNLINEIKTKLSLKDKVELYKFLHGEVSKAGRKGDTELAHINRFESKVLKMLGGSGSINPRHRTKRILWWWRFWWIIGARSSNVYY
jgi:hypothetical protein